MRASGNSSWYATARPRTVTRADRWTVTYEDSQALEGSEAGTIHPNYVGHQQIAKYERKAVLHALFP